MEKKKIILIDLFVILMLTLVWGGPLGNIFAGPINMIDEGQFMSWAQHMLNGDLMYRDIYITYGPLHVLPLYFISKVFGPSVWLTRVFLSIGTYIGILASYLIMKELEIKRVFRWFGIFVILFLQILQLRQGVGLLSVYFLLDCMRSYSKGKILFLGIISSISFLISPDVGLIVLIVDMSYLIFFLVKEKHIKKSFEKILFFLIGICLVISIFVSYSNQQGWFKDYLLTTSDVFSSFSGVNLPNGKNFPSPKIFSPNLTTLFIKQVLSKEAFLYYGILIYVISTIYCLSNIIISKYDQKAHRLFVVVLFGLLLYQVVISRSGIGHFFFVLSPLIIILSFFLQELTSQYSEKSQRYVTLILGLLILLFFARLIKIDTPSIISNLNYLHSTKTSSIKRIGFLKIPSKQNAYFTELKNYTDKNTNLNDKIFIFSNEPLLYFILNRNNVSKYDLPYIAITKEKRYELLDTLKRKPPKIIIENTSDWPVDEVSNRRRLPEIVQFIDQNYKKDIKISSTVVYKLKK